MNLPLDWPMYESPESARQARLCQHLRDLDEWHRTACAPYGAIARKQFARSAEGLSALPWLAVRLFKQHRWCSVPEQDLIRELTSSGTTGARLSRVVLDRDTAARQQRVLVKTLETVLGPSRRPLGLIETPPVVAAVQVATVQVGASSKLVEETRMPATSARQAGGQGVSLFGRTLERLLKAPGEIDTAAWDRLLTQAGEGPLTLFGFTDQIWLLVKTLKKQNQRLQASPQTVLLHTGGWKKLQDEAVSPESFREALSVYLGVSRVHDFYGMAEQTGSVFLACPEGHFHVSAYNHVIIRDPLTWKELPPGKTGLVQVMSALPTSYPGHSLLTEDLGYVVADDHCACGWRGRHFGIQGRIPAVENRGCSNV